MAAWVCGWAAWAAAAPEPRFEALQLGDRVFSNAVILSRTRTDIFVQHAGGLANVKVKDLPAEALARLGYAVPADSTAPVHAREPEAEPAPELTKVTERLVGLVSQGRALRPTQIQWQQTWVRPAAPGQARMVALAVLGATLAVYLFLCYCAKSLVEKTGQPAGGLIWVPVLQLVPLLRAAGMSGWWLVAWFVPGLNLVAMTLWSFKIVERRNKSPVWAVLLLLPFTNLLAFLYLAFSGGESPSGRGHTGFVRQVA